MGQTLDVPCRPDIAQEQATEAVSHMLCYHFQKAIV